MARRICGKTGTKVRVVVLILGVAKMRHWTGFEEVGIKKVFSRKGAKVSEMSVMRFQRLIQCELISGPLVVISDDRPCPSLSAFAPWREIIRIF
jgi:hypothetical protein